MRNGSSKSNKTSTKVTVSKGVIEEFKDLVRNIEGSVQGHYSSHVERAMNMYIDTKRGLDSRDNLRNLSERVDLILDELGVSESRVDAEIVTDRLMHRFGDKDEVDKVDIEELVSKYAEYPLPRDEIERAVSEDIYQQLNTRPVDSLRRGERVNVEVKVISTVGDEKADEGYVADRTGSIRFTSSEDLYKNARYRITSAKVIDRRDTEYDGRSEKVLKISDISHVSSLDKSITGFSGNFEGYGIVTGFDEKSSAAVPDQSDFRLVAYFDNGSKVYRTRLNSEVIIEDIVGGGSPDSYEYGEYKYLYRQAKKKLFGNYFFISGYENTDVEENSRDFSGVVAGKVRKGVLDEHISGQSPSFDTEHKPHVRVFNSEIERVSFATDFGPEQANYSLLPTGHRANKILVVGTLSRIRDTGKAVSAAITDASNSTVEFFVPKKRRQRVAKNLLRLANDELPIRVGVLGRIRPGTESDTIISLRDFFVADEVVEDTWVRETVNRTRQRALEKPFGEEAIDEYGVPPENVWNDIKKKLVKNSSSAGRVL